MLFLPHNSRKTAAMSSDVSATGNTRARFQSGSELARTTKGNDMPDKISKQKYQKMVYEKAKKNHIWINAFDCIHPSDELKKHVGEVVLHMLNCRETIPSDGITSANETVRELAVLTPILYISVNKS